MRIGVLDQQVRMRKVAELTTIPLESVRCCLMEANRCLNRVERAEETIVVVGVRLRAAKPIEL